MQMGERQSLILTMAREQGRVEATETAAKLGGANCVHLSEHITTPMPPSSNRWPERYAATTRRAAGSPPRRSSTLGHEIYNQEMTITGSMAVLHSRECAAALFATGVLDPDVSISNCYSLADYPTTLKRMQAGEGPKILVTL